VYRNTTPATPAQNMACANPEPNHKPNHNPYPILRRCGRCSISIHRYIQAFWMIFEIRETLELLYSVSVKHVTKMWRTFYTSTLSTHTT